MEAPGFPIDGTDGQAAPPPPPSQGDLVTGRPPSAPIDDSITLGQLKAMVNAVKRKVSRYDFPASADSDTLMSEIQEFYSYVEVPQVLDNRAAWEEAYSEEWSTLTPRQRRAIVTDLLECLERKDPEMRNKASRRLLYVLQGTFAHTTSPEHQLHWMIENARLVRDCGGLEQIYAAFKLACWKHDYLSGLPDYIPGPSVPGSSSEPPEPLMTAADKADYLDELNVDLSLYLSQLYLLVETWRGDEGFGEECMSLDPPLPCYLWSTVAGLREKNAKGYPVKKLLLLLWKSLLATFGGMKDVERCKRLTREMEGLKVVGDDKPNALKTSPLDYLSFQNEVAAKYPTFTPPKPSEGESFPLEKLAQVVAPIPVRPYGPAPGAGPSLLDAGPAGAAGGFTFGGATRAGMNPHQPPGTGFGPGTPASTPPPTPPPAPPPPKPNKQKYQTDQSRPFVFPFSVSAHGRGRLVPFSIDEAGNMYNRDMFISTEAWQMWQIREQLIEDESGMGKAKEGGLGGGEWASEARSPGESSIGPSSSMGDPTGSGTDSSSSSSSSKQLRGTGEPSLERVRAWAEAVKEEIAQEEARPEGKPGEGEGEVSSVETKFKDRAKIRRLKERKTDLTRLENVDVVYGHTLPHLQSAVIVLLKLLLATVTASSNQNPAQSSSGFQMEGVDQPPPTLEDIDVMRHREITSKAVSAILLLSLKWFKASHAMKFHYLSQLLVDSNCLLLILKMFGLQEVANSVKAKNEADEYNFFRYCYLHGSHEQRPMTRPEDSILSGAPAISRMSSAASNASTDNPLTANGAEGDEVELLTDYSWRNFFANINFTRILQKLTKRRIHRVLLLVQYKSSAILKRVLKVPHPVLQLYILKVIKSQVPFCGRKWRQSNMKVITAIYLNCRPDLRDEWLAGVDIDGDVEEALPQEQALRSLVGFYNSSRFPAQSANLPGHRRSSSSVSID